MDRLALLAMFSVEVRALSKTYGSVRALDQVSFQIEQGEVFALLGANGAGKSTTIQIILGLRAPSSGSATVMGLDCASQRHAVQSRLAYVPEQVVLYPQLSAIETVDHFLRLSGIRLEPAAIRSALGRVGLAARSMNERVGTYSKGMRQKVALALALARKSDVLLLDEPSSGLDPQAAVELSGLLRELSQSGTAILMASHDLFRVREEAKRAAIMRQGKIVRIVETRDIGAQALEQIYLQEMRA